MVQTGDGVGVSDRIYETFYFNTCMTMTHPTCSGEATSVNSRGKEGTQVYEGYIRQKEGKGLYI